MDTSGISAITNNTNLELDDTQEEEVEESSYSEILSTTEDSSEQEQGQISVSIISNKTLDQTDVSMKSIRDPEPQDVSMSSTHDSICEMLKEKLKLNTSDGSLMSLGDSRLSEKKIDGSNYKSSMMLVKPIIHKAKMCLLKKF